MRSQRHREAHPTPVLSASAFPGSHSLTHFLFRPGSHQPTFLAAEGVPVQGSWTVSLPALPTTPSHSCSCIHSTGSADIWCVSLHRECSGSTEPKRLDICPQRLPVPEGQLRWTGEGLDGCVTVEELGAVCTFTASLPHPQLLW